MRSVKSRLLSAWACVLTTARALPQGHGNVVGHGDGATPRPCESSVLGWTVGGTYAQAKFSLCLSQGDDTSHDDESLVLDFSTFAAHESCGDSSNITLNDVQLPQQWLADTASGVGSFSVPALHPGDDALAPYHDLDFEWESACLRPNPPKTADVQSTSHPNESETAVAAQVLSVVIKAVDGKPLQHPAGFTISFKQTAPPQLLRFAGTPNPSAGSEAQAEDWRAPPPHLRLAPAHPSLEEHLRDLQSLEAESRELNRLIHEKKKHIHTQLIKEAKEAASELRDCENVTCLLNLIKHKAHGAWRLLVIQLRPERYSQPSEMGRPNDPYQQVWRPGTHEATIKGDGSPSPPPYDEAGEPARPIHGSGGSNESVYVCVLKIVVGVLCCGCLVGVIRHRCSSPRSRTAPTIDEERNDFSPHRRRGPKSPWRAWWRRRSRWDQERIEDYEEKRALINPHEMILEEAMQEEIRQLRTAHGIVNSLVQAEEGRIVTSQSTGHRHCSCNHGYSIPPSPTSSTYSSDSLADLSSRPLSRTSSLPGYHSDTSTAPPAYESDDDVGELVANGYRVNLSTMSNASRWTPDSSVVDVSPRPSAETLRYLEATDTGGHESVY
ncbi:uncharacterized protein EI97DRAFT_168039 [Westerdykella ornata]|uniref:Uncharacterized protein n=1 Tax=Westerdykella ornata TaxID=318751 RepID=A0A6A6JSF9_WESOR|nr:uncharacterized protein EI97DRAFT_168039 [Westerdykella ornata]KAF2279195.1 hypothetical protein EI97DRAFT_168039 [Westerdykella ornata]